MADINDIRYANIVHLNTSFSIQIFCAAYWDKMQTRCEDAGCPGEGQREAKTNPSEAKRYETEHITY